jgi:hypothetical protein
VKVAYKGVEIVVRTGSHGEEIAHAVVDAEQRCFLGGLAEAKQFLRERAYGALSGPRAASWWIDLDSGCSASYSLAENALSDSAYWIREGRAHKLWRRELCRQPGCDGSGEVSARFGGRYYSHRPCPRHEEPVDVLELDWRP